MEKFNPEIPQTLRQKKQEVNTSHWKETPLSKEEQSKKRLKEVNDNLRDLGEIINGDHDVIAIPEGWDEKTLEDIVGSFEKLKEERANIMEDLGRDPLLD